MTHSPSAACGKFVYLFELDSVRKTDREIIAGQKALYNEIVANGNTVVLTFNQIVDSRWMFSLLKDKNYYDSLVSLFASGAIRVSQLGDIRTVAQYLLRSVEADKKFIYSAFPLKYSQKHLTALMQRSLMYSDLTEIALYCSGERTIEECRELFAEVGDDGAERPSQLSDDEISGILGNMYWFLSAVLRISALPNIYISPRDSAEYRHMHMHHILSHVVRFKNDSDPLWKDAATIISRLKCFAAGNDNRSVYLREISGAAPPIGDRRAYQYAEAVIDACYNFTNEISICNVSKHYSTSVFENVDIYDMPVASFLPDDGSDERVFYDDFFGRLRQDWGSGDGYPDNDERYLSDESNEFEPFRADINDIPDFRNAVRVIDYIGAPDSTNNSGSVPRYEYHEAEQSELMRRDVGRAMRKKLFFAFICIAMACLIELGFNLFHDGVDELLVSINSPIFAPLETIIFLFIAEALTAAISKIYPSLQSLSEALHNIGQVLTDSRRIRRDRGRTYHNANQSGADKPEKSNKSRKISFVRSLSIREYIKLRHSEKGSSLFSPLDGYDIENTDDPERVEKLINCEELHGVRFGVVYKSDFNTVIADPIKDGHGGYFAYDRVTPTSGKSGVVIAARYSGKFILLKQRRHAIRREQLSFPRGFAESFDADAAESAKRELREEIGAVMTKEPEFIGRITPDSGLSTVTASVFLADLDSYTPQIDHEGIENTVELDMRELMAKIAAGEIDDGFTLGAAALLNARYN